MDGESHPPIATTSTLARASLYGFGAIIIGVALVVYSTQLGVQDIFEWLERVFGVGFTVLYGSMILVALYAGSRINGDKCTSYWFEAGMQTASAVATLALTFTLLGISLGISTLSQQDISPETVQDVIHGLTANFSTAFMTTVVGLPTANVLRAYIVLKRERTLIGLDRRAT